MRQRLCSTSLVACAVVAAGCGSDEPTAPDRGGVAVVVAFDRSPATPGDTVYATVTATPTGGARIAFVRVTAHGLVVRTDSVAISAAGARGAQSTTQRYVLPSNAVGTLWLTAVAGAPERTGSAEASLVSADTTPPQIDSARAAPSARHDTVRVILAASDNAGLAAVVVRFSGAFALIDSAQLVYPRRTLDTASYAVPAGADLTRPLGIAVDVWDVGGQRAHTELGPFQLEDPLPPNDPPPPPVDNAPPVLSSALIAPGGMPAVHFSAASYLPGDLVTVRLEANDDVRLARMGYRIGAPVNLADSVDVNTSSAIATRTFTVLPSWRGVAPVTFFAVDAVGRRTEVAVAPMSVYAVVSRPMRGVVIPGSYTSVSDVGITVTDAVFDAKRHVVYLAQPDSNRVLVLSTTTMTFGAPIAVPRAPMGVDLTPSGDTLVIALRRTHAIAVVDLSSAAPVVDTLHIEVPYWMAPLGPGQLNYGPGQVRVTARGEAFIRFNLDGTGFTPLWLYDIAARRQRHRTDGGFNGVIFDNWTFAPSGDRSRVVVFQDCLICTANVGQIYDAATDAFGPRTYTTQTYGATVSLDRRGDRVLIASSLFDRDLGFLRTFAPPGFDLGFKRMHSVTPTAIVPDGDLAYMSIKDGAYYLVRTADGGVLEKVLLPATTKRLLIVEGGGALLSIGLTSDASRTRADLVDLR
jgi:hypothetical protein